MRICKAKLEIAMARACMGRSDLRKFMSPQTITRIFRDPQPKIKTKTIGRIAAALDVDVLDIIEAEGGSGQ